MRISTFSFNQSAVNGILNDQSALSTTQNQISTGKSVNTPADNPVAAVMIAQLTTVQTTNTQYTSNGKSATTSLDLEENALSTSTTTLQSIRDLLVQANDGSENTNDLQSIATQIKSLESSLLATANSQDAAGNYLFGGYSVSSKPFVRDSSGSVQYTGDAGVSSVQVDSSTSVQLNDPGSNVYMNILSGNGTFATAATSTNSGDGIIDTGSVTSASQWKVSGTTGPYTISFSDPTGSTDATDYTVKDSLNNTVATGTYDPSSGGSISFDGIEVGITGTPNAGDSFTVSASTNKSAFDNLDSIVSALNSTTSDSASRAQLTSQLNTALQQVDQALNQISTVSSSVGARINMVSSVATSVTTQQTTIATQLSNLGDLDYASATSKLSEQSVALQAAESSYAAIAQLSLFKYL